MRTPLSLVYGGRGHTRSEEHRACEVADTDFAEGQRIWEYWESARGFGGVMEVEGYGGEGARAEGVGLDGYIEEEGVAFNAFMIDAFMTYGFMGNME